MNWVVVRRLAIVAGILTIGVLLIRSSDIEYIGRRDVTALAYATDGKQILIGTADGEIHRRAVAGTVRQTRHNAGYDMPVTNAICVLSESQYLTAGNGPELRIWNLDTGKLLRGFSCDAPYFTDLACSADRLRAVTASYGPGVTVWNIAAGAPECRLSAEGETFVTVAFVSNDRCILAGSIEGQLVLWRANDRSVLSKTMAHDTNITAVAVSDEAQLIASASHDGTIKLWRVGEGLAPVATLRGIQFASDLTFVGDSLLCVCNVRGPIWLIDGATGQLVDEIEPPAGLGPLRHVAASPSHRRIVLGGVGGAFEWDYGRNTLEAIRLPGR